MLAARTKKNIGNMFECNGHVVCIGVAFCESAEIKDVLDFNHISITFVVIILYNPYVRAAFQGHGVRCVIEAGRVFRAACHIECEMVMDWETHEMDK